MKLHNIIYCATTRQCCTTYPYIYIYIYIYISCYMQTIKQTYIHAYMLTYMLHAYIHSTLHYTTLHYNHYITYICFVATIHCCDYNKPVCIHNLSGHTYWHTWQISSANETMYRLHSPAPWRVPVHECASHLTFSSLPYELTELTVYIRQYWSRLQPT